MPDFQIVAGDTLPVFNDTLTYSNGAIAEPETVSLVARSLNATEPVTLAGTSAVVSKTAGTVSYTPSASDPWTAGEYLGKWVAKVGGKQMTFPTVGWLSIRVELNIATAGPQLLVSLPEVKDHMFLKASDRTHDDMLVNMIEAAGPLIENLTGPVLLERHDEWYEGGRSSISLRHKPSYGYGTSPVLNVIACSEYRGPIEYNISLVGTPTQGSVYSAMVNQELGTIVRRTSGGGTYEWWHDPSHPQQSVHIIYQAGQETVPSNVKQAALETIRWWWETTEAVGKGSLTQADAEFGKPLAALPYHAVAMLAPTRRHPSFA